MLTTEHDKYPLSSSNIANSNKETQGNACGLVKFIVHFSNVDFLLQPVLVLRLLDGILPTFLWLTPQLPG